MFEWKENEKKEEMSSRCRLTFSKDFETFKNNQPLNEAAKTKST